MKVDRPSGRETLIAKVPRWLPDAAAVAGNICEWLSADLEVKNAINSNRPSE